MITSLAVTNDFSGKDTPREKKQSSEYYFQCYCKLTHSMELSP